MALATPTLDNATTCRPAYAINFTPSTDSTVETLVAIGSQDAAHRLAHPVRRRLDAVQVELHRPDPD